MTIPARLKTFFRTIRLRRFLLWSCLAVGIGLLLVGALVAALPTLVSSPSGQAYLRQTLTKALKRPVSLAHLNLSWSDGLAIKNLALGTGPAPLLKSTIGEAVMVPRVSRRDGRWRVDLELRIRTVSADLAPGPPKPPKPYQEPLTALAEALQGFQKMAWPLPFDLGVQLAIEPVNLTYSDPKTGRRLTLDNFRLHLAMPSLADQPLTAKVQGDLAVDGRRLEGVALTADLRRLVAADRRIRPAGAQIALKATLPGTTLQLAGGVQELNGFAATARLDLPRLLTAIGPFLPPTMPKVDGNLVLTLQAKADQTGDLRADLELNGAKLSLSGGKLRQGRVGPLDLRLRQGLTSDHRRQQVRFTDGSVASGTLLTAAWDATVDRPDKRDRTLAARLGPLRVDLRQAVAVAGPFLPPKFPLQEISGDLKLQQLTVNLAGRQLDGELAMAGLGVTLPRLRLALAKGGVVADGLVVGIDRATVPLKARQPTRVDGTLSYGVQRCAVTGRQPLAINGARGTLQLALTDLDLKSRSPRKVAATVKLQQALELQRVNLERKLAVNTLHEQLTAEIRARESGEIDVTLPELKINVASLQALAAGKELKPLPLAAILTASGIRLAAAKGAPPTVTRADCTISSGDALQLTANAGLSGGASPQVASAGTLRADLDRILPLAALFLPKGVAAGGITTLAWDLAAPLKSAPLPKEQNPLRRARAALGRVERADLKLTLANRALSWPQANDTITIGDLRTTQPLHLSLPGNGGKIRLDGGLTFAGLTGLPGKGKELPAQGGALTLKGELADWQVLRLHEELRIQPLGLQQQADATVSKIDALLEKADKLSTAALLQRLDVVLTTEMTAKFPATLTPVPGGVELSGESRAGLRVNLAAGRDLRLRATAATRDLGLRLKNGTIVEGVHADLLMDRTYTLAKGEASGWTPLSLSLVRPAPEQATGAGAAELVNRVREDLRGQERGSRKFTIRRIAVNSGKAPLELTALEGDLLLTPEEMGLSFFQAEVLGGTVRLRGLIDLKPEVPVVSMACSFTNLETFLLLPPETRKQSRKLQQETEITGEVSCDAPLLTGRRELLEGIRLRLNLRKIGADTLERALFGLDPYERNEQLVAQRKLLRHGRLKSLRADTLDGAFSLGGEIQVKGVDVALPKVERIRLAELPIQKQMAKTIAGVAATRKVLDLVRADTLVVGPKGKISLGRGGQE